MENVGLLFITSATGNRQLETTLHHPFFFHLPKTVLLFWFASLIVYHYVTLAYVFTCVHCVFSTQLSQIIVNVGGVAAVIDYLGDSKGNVRLPGIMMLGYVATHSENLAMAVIVSKVCYHILRKLTFIKRI